MREGALCQGNDASPAASPSNENDVSASKCWVRDRSAMREMLPQEVQAFLRHNRMGVLSLAAEGRAYALPLFYGYDGRDVYFHTSGGRKQEYLPFTTEACFAVVRVESYDSWASVQAFGRVESVNGSLAALNALMSVPLPPAWGESALGEPLRRERTFQIYKLVIQRLSGRYSQPPSGQQGESAALEGM